MPGGRPSKLTEEVQRRVCELVADGQTYEMAAMAAGIDVTTLTRWKRQGNEAKTGKYRVFRLAVLAAERRSNQKLYDIAKEQAERGVEEVRVTTQEVPVLDSKGNHVHKPDSKGRMQPQYRVTGRSTVSSRRPRDGKLALQMLSMRDPDNYGRQIVKHEGDMPNPGLPPPVVKISFGGEEETFNYDEEQDGDQGQS